MDPLLSVIVRHQVYLEGLKAGRNAELVKTIAKLDKALREQLAFIDYNSLSDMTRTALNKLVIELKKTARTVFDVWLNELIRWLEEYTSIDRDFWEFAYSMAQPEETSKLKEAPESESIFGLAGRLPMAANGVLMLAFLKGFATLATERIGQTVLMSYSNAETPRQLLNRLSGTAAARNRDGLLSMFNRQGAAVTNTVVQHLATQINSSVASKAWPRYIWISVLDDATTRICRDRNGDVYFFGQGPVPPAHVGCRSSIMPYFGTARPEMPSFRMWAQSQSADFINDAFDGEAPASYEGSKALTLAQFRAKRPLIVG